MKTKNASQLTEDCSGKSMKWEWRDPLPYGNGISAVASGNNILVGISDGGVVFASNDAINWQRIQTCTYHNFHGVTFGAGNFVAVGDSGTIYVSPDRRNWHGVKSGTICISENADVWKISSVSGPSFRFIPSEAVAFVAVSYPDHIYKSADAINWNKITIVRPQKNE